MPPPALDQDVCYRAVSSRDARFDGAFFTAVRTTGIYCRPVCPARTPLRRNVVFFAHAAAAEAAGYRSCRRCRPESSPGSRAWDYRADLVGRALRLIADGAADEGGVRRLAGRLAVSERHLHRLFLTELGVGPLAVARTARLQLAVRLLDETDLPVADVAYAAGFGSLRQFNAVVQEAYGRSPTALRREQPGDGRAGLRLRLAVRPPYDAEAVRGWLAARAVPGLEEVTGSTYRRSVRLAGGPAVLEADVEPDRVELRLPVGDPRHLAPLVAAARRVFDTDVDPAAVAAVLGDDPLLAPLVAARPGLRVAGAWDGFELAVRAVVGQQVSVAAARTLLGRLVTLLGEPLAQPVGGVTRLFPPAHVLADADLAGLGLPTTRTATLRALADAVARGDLVLDAGADARAVRAGLLAVPGIGPWTSEYVALRALRDPDALPLGDLVLRRSYAALRAGDPQAADLRHRAERWRPWRGYAAMHLWAASAATDAGRPTIRPDHDSATPTPKGTPA